MLFNSLQFLIFFPIVVALFFLLPQKRRWILLLIASYYFYMCWKVEYIVLIIISTLIDYFVAQQMDKLQEKAKKKKWLYLSLMSNLGILFGFKYFNFINENFSFGGEAMYSMLSSEYEVDDYDQYGNNNEGYTETTKSSMIIPKFMVRFYY
jgi:D-alanyl-lipoteichoic acid acyltransferase DltB (MBOAT superfamily)